MGSNDVVLLQDMIQRSWASVASHMTEPDHHTYFAAQHILRHYKPSHDDLLSGLVDGHHDGGIDGMYLYVNSLSIRDDVPFATMFRSTVSGERPRST